MSAEQLLPYFSEILFFLRIFPGMAQVPRELSYDLKLFILVVFILRRSEIKHSFIYSFYSVRHRQRLFSHLYNECQSYLKQNHTL